jgi:protein translocase SecG subunit
MLIMTTQYIIGGLVLLLSVAIVWLVGAQQSKRKSGLSGSIAGNGASETYLSRNKIASRESSYKKITLIVSIIFAVLVLALYVVGSVDPKEETADTSVESVESASEAN